MNRFYGVFLLSLASLVAVGCADEAGSGPEESNSSAADIAGTPAIARPMPINEAMSRVSAEANAAKVPAAKVATTPEGRLAAKRAQAIVGPALNLNEGGLQEHDYFCVEIVDVILFCCWPDFGLCG
jgi:hypothetical protein